MESQSNHRYEKIKTSERENIGFANLEEANRYKILPVVLDIQIRGVN